MPEEQFTQLEAVIDLRVYHEDDRILMADDFKLFGMVTVFGIKTKLRKEADDKWVEIHRRGSRLFFSDPHTRDAEMQRMVQRSQEQE